MKPKKFKSICRFFPLHYICKWFITISLIGIFSNAFCQDSVITQRKIAFFEPSPVYNKQRVQIAGYTTLGLYAGTMTGLYQLWYSGYEMNHFHFFNDNGEWLLMDKTGHTFSSYIAGKQGYNVCRWAGMDNKKATLIGGNLGWVFLASVEALDGFSSAWGFSWGDIAANTLGSSVFIGQQLLWQEQRMEFKFSFHQSKYAHYRPDLLGENYIQQLFKDYNGQTLWLSANINSFIKKPNVVPAWLNIAVGIGAEGMTGAFDNASEYKNNPIPYYKRYRQVYIAPDIDLTKIKTKSKALKLFFEVTRFIKFPLPALEINSKGKWLFHPIYF